MKLVEATAVKLLVLAVLLTSNLVSSKEDMGLFSLANSLVAGDAELIFSKLGPDFDFNQSDDKGQNLAFYILSFLPFQSEKGVAKTTAVIKKLLNRGVDVNQVDDWGNTVLHFAAVYGTPEVLKIILEKGVKVNRQGINGNTALHMVQPVAGKGKAIIQEKAELLMHYGANPKIKNNLGKTAKDSFEAELGAEVPSSQLKMLEILDSHFKEQNWKRFEFTL